MNSVYAKKLVFILLFAFCGQMLASPFLNCCVEMQHGQDTSSEMQQHTIVSHNDEMQMAERDPAGSHESTSVKADSTECNDLCSFCVVSNSTIVREPAAFNMAAGLAVNASNYAFFSTSSHLDTPFRPPIFT
ncbi:hypothetical protein OAP18_00520 [Gammaproteobacteria bacterium]|nr:hypothetical protein [Gammaproteobacteria bacterium]